MAAELSRLQSAFTAAVCDFIVLKGVVAALQGFGRIGLRQNRDIDILIDESDLARAVSTMLGLGYVQVEPAEPLTTSALRVWAKSHKDLVLQNRTSGIIVEIHWRLFDNMRYAGGLSELSTTKLRLPSGTVITALTVETAFAYMAAHGAQHAWSRLKWLADFAAYARNIGEVRVSELYNELRLRGLGGPVGQGLLLSHELAGLPLPKSLSQEAKLSIRLKLLNAFGRAAIGGPGALELEDRAFGSTLKTLSHYLLNGNLRYLTTQVVLDVSEVPKSHTSPWVRRFGPVAKVLIWIAVRLRRMWRGIPRSQS